MTVATEVRWFWQAKLDPKIEKWFRSSRDLLGKPLADTEKDARTDHYLVDDESTAYGLKLREEKLELKRLLESSFFRAPRTKVEGVAQIWTKSDWPYRVIKTAKLKDAVLGAFLREATAADIAPVAKRRWQRKYVPEANAKMKRVAMKRPLPHACNVELTALKLGNADWWTIAFEAYGDIEHPGTLSRTVDWFFERFEGGKPTYAQSESYPAWIARLRAG